jgi:SanA protein
MWKIIKSLFKIILALILIAVVCEFIVIFGGAAHVKSVKAVESGSGGYDCILVLGAGVYSDGSPTPMLKDRLDRGIELYKAGVADKMLLSGDNGQVDYDEVSAMKKYVLAAGVPAEDVFLDHAGFSTYESMYRAGAIFNVKSAVIVTQKYHEYRAVYIARRLGIDAVGVSAADIKYSGQMAREGREILARLKDFAYCIFKPKPTYLGDVIDISGDGRKTW